jgi:hypothetical protein
MSLLGLASKAVGIINALQSNLEVSLTLTYLLAATKILLEQYGSRMCGFVTGCQSIHS